MRVFTNLFVLLILIGSDNARGNFNEGDSSTSLCGSSIGSLAQVMHAVSLVSREGAAPPVECWEFGLSSVASGSGDVTFHPIEEDESDEEEFCGDPLSDSDSDLFMREEMRADASSRHLSPKLVDVDSYPRSERSSFPRADDTQNEGYGEDYENSLNKPYKRRKTHATPEKRSFPTWDELKALRDGDKPSNPSLPSQFEIPLSPRREDSTEKARRSAEAKRSTAGRKRLFSEGI